MDELVEVLARKRVGGMSEADALRLVRDAGTLANLFADGSLGRLPSVVQAFIDSGCAECAVNKAYSR